MFNGQFNTLVFRYHTLAKTGAILTLVVRYNAYTLFSQRSYVTSPVKGSQ